MNREADDPFLENIRFAIQQAKWLKKNGFVSVSNFMVMVANIQQDAVKIHLRDCMDASFSIHKIEGDE